METNVLSPGYPEYLRVSVKGKMVPQMPQSQMIPNNKSLKYGTHIIANKIKR
jgi:hypothetical protein